MIQQLKRILRFLPAIQKILTTILDVIEDLSDDGVRNGSNASKGSGIFEGKKK